MRYPSRRRVHAFHCRALDLGWCAMAFRASRWAQPAPLISSVSPTYMLFALSLAPPIYSHSSSGRSILTDWGSSLCRVEVFWLLARCYACFLTPSFSFMPPDLLAFLQHPAYSPSSGNCTHPACLCPSFFAVADLLTHRVHPSFRTVRFAAVQF